MEGKRKKEKGKSAEEDGELGCPRWPSLFPFSLFLLP
jgi:hypothetical protein